jgi:hypothetical protein
MAISLHALELENRSIGAHGEPTLAAAYVILCDAWWNGDRDRELALHLMFLCWYMLIEPPHITGLDEGRLPSSELVRVFNGVYDIMAPGSEADPEFLYVVGLMSALAPWLLGDNDTWGQRSRDYQDKYWELKPTGLDPAFFDGRGFYGHYFAGQARVAGGY